MAEVIIMPKLGFNMDEGELVEWKKKEGESVKAGEVLFEINTDKTTMPVEATADATVLKLLISEGDTVDVFTPIAVLGNPGEDPNQALAAFGGEISQPATAEDQPVELPTDLGVAEVKPIDFGSVSATTPTASVDIKDLKLTPKAKKLIAERGLDLNAIAQLKGTGFEGGITAADINSANICAEKTEQMHNEQAPSNVKASPLAAKMADDMGVDMTRVTGTGVGGKVMSEDVQRVAAHISDVPNKKIAKVTPYKGIRKVIGEKLAASMFTAPHIFFTESVDTTNLTAFRKQLNENTDVKIAVSDLLTMAACKALKKYPELNASLIDGEIVQYESINVGTAVAADSGLIVPVVKNVQNKSLTDVAIESKDLVSRAKAGKLDLDDYSDGTFSISNLGPFGIENFTAIINAPESAILAVSAIKKTAVVVADEEGNDSIAIKPIMKIQLSADHRLIDGLLAAQFTVYMKQLLENPMQILM